MSPATYDDDYPTCQETYATLRIYLGKGVGDVSTVTEMLEIEPTWVQVNGTRPPAWFLETRGVIPSKDVRRHVDWLLDKLDRKSDVVHGLQKKGCSIDIFCYWVSAHGHGGPMLNPETMGRLADLRITIGFDIYGGDGVWV